MLPDQVGCFGDAGLVLSSSEAKLEFNAEDLSHETSLPTSYMFRVFVTKSDRESAGYADQILRVKSGDPPQMAITCVLNCDSSMNPTERLALQAECTNCRKKEKLSYEWTLVNADDDSPSQINWEGRSSTGKTRQSVTVTGGVFVSDVSHSYTFIVTGGFVSRV